MSDEACNCQNVQSKGNGLWQCMLCRRKFLPADICFQCPQVQAGPQLHVKPPDLKLVSESEPTGKHEQTDTDCHGVNIDLLLAGTESECPDCEAELCNVRQFPQ